MNSYNTQLIAITIFVLIVLFVINHGNPHRVNRNSCLSKIINEYNSNKNLYYDFPSDSITMAIIKSQNSNLFQINANKHDEIILTSITENKIINRVFAKQYDYGNIKELIVSQNQKWLWINGDETDYIANIKIKKESIEILKPQRLPEVYFKPCSFFGALWNNCIESQGYYSHTLDRVLISGYKKTFLGVKKFVAYEITDEGKKLLPKEMYGANFIKIRPDIDYLIESTKEKGVFFQRIDGQIYLYDGKQLTFPSICQ